MTTPTKMELADVPLPSLAQTVRDLHRVHPDWGATIIASKLRCNDAYVRAVAKRHGLKLPRSPYGAVPTHGAAYIARRRALAAQEDHHG